MGRNGQERVQRLCFDLEIRLHHHSLDPVLHKNLACKCKSVLKLVATHESCVVQNQLVPTAISLLDVVWKYTVKLHHYLPIKQYNLLNQAIRIQVLQSFTC